jgi:diadenosine tetraphosphate (Ap4A) HIT family hydrolase
MTGPLKYNHKEARFKEQAARMKSLEERAVCAFCPENIVGETTSPIELETAFWLVKANDFPYDHTKHHFLVIPKTHVSTISQLPDAFLSDFLGVIKKVEKRFKLKSYAVTMRSGDMRYNGGSVEHLHAHIIVGDTGNPNHEPVRFKVSSKPK